VALNKTKATYSFNEIVPSASVMKHKMAFTSDFLIVRLEETAKRSDPHEVQKSHYWNFFYGDLQKISITKKIRDLQGEYEFFLTRNC
jgi:hypothetical protein